MAVAVGGAGGEGGGVLGGGVEGLGGVADEGVDAAGGVGDLFGEGFEADDLVGAGLGGGGQLGGRGQIAGGAGLQQEGADTGAAQQHPAGAEGAELTAAGQIAGGRAVRFEAEQRGAPAAQCQARPAVEVAGARGGGAVGAGRGGQVGLEGAEAQFAVDRAVAVLIDQRWLIRQGGKAVHPLLLPKSPPDANETSRPVGLTGKGVVR